MTDCIIFSFISSSLYLAPLFISEQILSKSFTICFIEAGILELILDEQNSVILKFSYFIDDLHNSFNKSRFVSNP